MSKRRTARRARREALLAADAVRRLRPPAVLQLDASRLGGGQSRRRREDLLAGLRQGGLDGGLSRGSPFSASAVPVQPAAPPGHPNCRSTLVPSGTLAPAQAEAFIEVLLGESKLLEHVRVVPMEGHPRTPPTWDGTDNHRGRSTRGMLRGLP